MPKGMKAIVESGERVGNGWAQDGVQVGQRGFGQRLQQDEIEDAEAGVGEETVADVKEGLGFEWRVNQLCFYQFIVTFYTVFVIAVWKGIN